MSEVAQQMARFQLEVQSLQAQLQTRPTATKELSMVSLVPKCEGSAKAVPLHEFVEKLKAQIAWETGQNKTSFMWLP